VVALGAPAGPGALVWVENVLGVGNLWTRHTVAGTFDQASHVSLQDLSGDGDLDLLVAGAGSPTRWLENAAGNGLTWTPGTLPLAQQTAVAVGDLDGDQDLDVASSRSSFDGPSWTENVAGNGSAWSPHTIATAQGTTDAMAAADFDGDSDLDVLRPGVGAGGTAVWYENVGGGAASWSPHTVPGTQASLAVVETSTGTAMPIWSSPGRRTCASGRTRTESGSRGRSTRSRPSPRRRDIWRSPTSTATATSTCSRPPRPRTP
jgi:hypothetical protein